MPNLNKVMIMGNLTRDPELRYTPSNMPVCQLGVAVNRRWTDRNTNEQREETTFIDCDAFGRTAEVLSQYLRKGRPVYLEGRLKLDQWEDQQGNKRSKLKVVVETFQFIDSRGGEGNSGGGGDFAPSRQSRPRQQQAAPPPQEDYHQPVDDDEIPF
jgi:single-strand DNA-binding protein